MVSKYARSVCRMVRLVRRSPNMVFTQGRGFVLGASFGLLIVRSVVAFWFATPRTPPLWQRDFFGKLLAVVITFGFGEKRCRKNLPLGDLVFNRLQAAAAIVYDQTL